MINILTAKKNPHFFSFATYYNYFSLQIKISNETIQTWTSVKLRTFDNSNRFETDKYLSAWNIIKIYFTK